MVYKVGENGVNRLFGDIASFLRRCLFRVLSVGPIPTHLAFIMDGNRRYAKKKNLEEGDGHKAGYLALMSMLYYCYELGIKYVTVYAFSIENFKRRPDEVHSLMDLMLEKIEALLMEGSIVNQYGIRVEGCENLGEKHHAIKLVDVEKHMYMAVAPDPDILIRSSGETRLSNFLLWQTSHCPLYSPAVLWPEIAASITSGLDEVRSISVAKITQGLKQHMRSISIVEGSHNVKPSDHPVVTTRDLQLPTKLSFTSTGLHMQPKLLDSRACQIQMEYLL
ncbi:hypothetical protein REPUB_Repub09cG0205900 [Reevesia pubescens]